MTVKRTTQASSIRRHLRGVYDRLWSAYGPQNWWPAETATEVVVGAILTQNTNRANVERAIENMRRVGALDWKALRDLTESELAELIRPSGTYRVKAARLAAFVDYLWQRYDGSLSAMLDGDLDGARDRLLSIHGIGPETADALLLYGGRRATFVVDAYTRRILRRHLLIDDLADYEAVRKLFHEAIPPDARVYNEYHALLVAVGKRHCRARARCDGCPLAELKHDETL